MTEDQTQKKHNSLTCHGCACLLDLGAHADLVCDGQVWCSDCRDYPPELLAGRSFTELKDWCVAICASFRQAPVRLLENPEARNNWRLYWREEQCLLAEAYHEHRAILLYPPGQRLTTLCHELAHIFTGEDHTPAWAATFARLIAWVKAHGR